MDNLTLYKSFIYGHNLTDGIRMTVGIVVPAFIMLYFNQLPIGLVMSVGALCVSVTDIPGPIRYRRNEMLICMAVIFVVSIYVGLASYSGIATGILLTFFCFIFSMLGIYGNRAGSIGIAALLVMVLNFNYLYRGLEIFGNALYILAGGCWYFLFSIILQRLRPYKLVQQAMGDYIQSMSDYLRIRASFYKADTNYEEGFKELLQKQVIVQQKHELVSELIFKTRGIAKASTQRGRILVMIFLEASALFDSIMTTYQDYATLHDYFDETGILGDFHLLALKLSAQSDEIGLALKSGRRSAVNDELVEQIGTTKKKFQELRTSFLKPDNIEGFINLRQILENVQDMANRLHTLHQYTSFDRRIKKPKEAALDAAYYVTHQEVTISKLWDSLSFDSNIFRHSLRVTIAAVAGYVLSKFLPLGHSYWILLTIIVILKPAYSLTQQRNKNRLAGTISGAMIGVGLLLLVKNTTLLLVMMILLMTAANIAIRTRYFLSVLLMTVYLLIFFYLLEPAHFNTLLKERIIDTAIGSVIAFIATHVIVPDWERRTIKSYLITMLEDNLKYFEIIAAHFRDGEKSLYHDRQRSGKMALVSLANLSDAFNRMLSEPKSQQKQIAKIHQLVVLCHRLTSHIATLGHYHESGMKLNDQVDLVPVISRTVSYLTGSVSYLNRQPLAAEMEGDQHALMQLYEEVNILLERRRQELKAGQLETATKKTLSELKSLVDQFKFIYNIAKEIQKIVQTLELA